MRTRRSRGFTLIELMVVITILGLLAGITSVGVMRYLSDARTKTAKMDMRAMVQAIKQYRLDKHKIPDSIEELCGDDEDTRYLERATPPKDPWSGEYLYEPRDRKNYDLRCLGSDGVEGGEGEAKDITLADLEGDDDAQNGR